MSGDFGELQLIIGGLCQVLPLLCHQMTDLFRGQGSSERTEQGEEVFLQLKGVLFCEPMLAAINFECPFKFACNPSDTGIGSVLLQCTVARK